VKELTGKYLVDQIEWRGGAKVISTGELLPSEYWFDVDMGKDFWYRNVENHTDEETTPKEALYDFFWEYLDKSYFTEPVHWRIRSFDEVRNEKINSFLDINEKEIGKSYQLLCINKEDDINL